MNESLIHKTKSLLFFLVMLLLWLPLLQNTFLFFEEEPLGGAINNVEKPLYSFDSFLTGEFQNQLEEYQKSSFGFRNIMIRLNNQKMFSFYNIAKANGVIVGKQDYLFEEPYIKAYLGLDFVGMEVIKSNVKKLLKVKQFLNEKGKDIIFVIAPGKASFYPEYIPDKYFKKEKGITNYEAYLKEFKAYNINFVDFKAWFVENKNKSKYPLYPKCGIHWSKYGEYMVADSLIKYIEQLRKIDLPDLVLDSIVISKKQLFEDYDLANGMNLIFELKSTKMAYPYTHIISKNNQKTLKSLVIGDSFYWGLFNRYISHQIFDNGEFWYYNKTAYSSTIQGTRPVYEIDISKTIEENDLFILLFSEVNMKNFDYGFTNSLYEYFYDNNPSEKEDKIKKIIMQINNNPEWLETLKKQAIKENITLDEAIRNNALYVIMVEENKK